MSLRGLDEWITGHWGDDYWNQEVWEYAQDFVCGFCRSDAHSFCQGKNCSCSGRYGHTAATHGPCQGPVRLVMENAPATLNDTEDFDEWLKRQLPNK